MMMDGDTFSQFIDKLKVELQNPLPGEPAQYKMAPAERIQKKEGLKLNANPKLSAVLCLLYPNNNQPYFSLIERSSYKGVHSAQISFPGGKKDVNDVTSIDTALRETEEEIGVSVLNNEIIGQLSEVYIPPSGFLVQPYVAAVNSTPNFIKDPREVQQIIEVPLQTLLDDKIIGRKEIKTSSGYTFNYPYFDILGHTVWGATAMMLSELKELVNESIR